LASELVWIQRLEEKSSASAGDRTPVVQSVVKYFTELPQLMGSHSSCLNKFGRIIKKISKISYLFFENLVERLAFVLDLHVLVRVKLKQRKQRC
jgi:hypothetical protein